MLLKFTDELEEIILTDEALETFKNMTDDLNPVTTRNIHTFVKQNGKSQTIDRDSIKYRGTNVQRPSGIQTASS